VPAPNFAAYLDHYMALVGSSLTPTPGKLFVQPGEQVAWDQCDCDGQGWSRLVRAEPVYGTSKANGQVCVIRWDVQFAVGVLRCVSGPTNKGALPSGAVITTEGHTFADDFAALMQAVECDQYVHRVLEAVPLGPEGGCAGSEVRFIVRLSPCCD
jgi:hypothetical protein